MTINILHLYPKEMNLYGDHGNVLTLVRRCEWRGIKAKVIPHEIGEPLPKDIDIIFGGGGQDSGQNKIEEDLIRLAPKLKKLIDDGMPCLVVCGLYQLFGRAFVTADSHRIQGTGILDLETHANKERLIGNIIVQSPQFGEIVGYENHSGLTKLDNPAECLGKVIDGAGNNGQDGTEGCFYKNCIGTYMHGPILPKNPQIADYLIKKAIERQGKNIELKKLNDHEEEQAHRSAVSRPR
jgi:CobQ-like glutamine amidotransferase family enzyme